MAASLRHVVMLLLTVGAAALLILATGPAVASPPDHAKASQGFTQGITLDVDGEPYYFAGPELGPDGERDVPGHYWVQAGPNQVAGKHYNTGPGGDGGWWSSDAPDHELLYVVHAVIDTWSEEKAEWYAKRGYVHYHELVHADTGVLHPEKVVWLKHTARTSFTLDGGPMPDMEPHEVTPGIDFEFMPNYDVPYTPDDE